MTLIDDKICATDLLTDDGVCARLVQALQAENVWCVDVDASQVARRQRSAVEGSHWLGFVVNGSACAHICSTE